MDNFYKADQDSESNNVNEAKDKYQKLIMKFLMAHELNDSGLKKFLLQVPKCIVSNM